MLPITFETNNQPAESQFWVQCENCKLYLNTNEQMFQNLLCHYPGPIHGSTSWVCNSCREKSSLLVQLGNMNETIKHLNACKQLIH